MTTESDRSKCYGWETPDPLADHSYTLPAIKRLLPSGTFKILDAGCGNGFIAAQLAAMGHDVTAVDASPDGIEIATEAYPDVHFITHSVYDDFSPVVEPVDIVVASEVVEHLFSPETFLRNANNILRPDGHIIITTPYHGYLKNLALSMVNGWDKHHTVDWEGGHIKFFSEKTLSRMLTACGFNDCTFANSGRVRWLWKSMVCRAHRNTSAATFDHTR